MIPAPSFPRFVLRKLFFSGFSILGGMGACLVPSHADLVFFKAGGKMEGTLLQSNGNILQLKHKAASTPLPLKYEGIRWVLLNQTGDIMPYEDKLLLTNGDLVSCSITGIDAENVTILTLNNQTLKIKRPHISTLYFSMGGPVPLISKPQSFAPREVTGRPEVPAFFSTQREEKKENAHEKSPTGNEASGADQLISVDNWQGRATRRWKWLGDEQNHTLEIPAGRGLISKNIGLTDKFTLKGNYFGPTPELRKTRIGMANNCYGIVMIFGSTYTDVSRYLEQNVSSNFYSLELLPDKINLCRLSDRNGKRKTILLRQPLPADAQKRGTEYRFELSANGNEFKLSVNGNPTMTVIDPVGGMVTPGRFSLLNTEYTPVILKNLTLTTKLSDKTFTNPLGLKWEEKHPELGFLLTRDGDVMPGTLSLFSQKDKHLEWQIFKDTGIPKSIGLEFIASLILSPSAREQEKPHIRLSMISGGSLSGTLVSMDADSLKLKNPAFGELVIPRFYVRMMELLSTPALAQPQASEPKPPTAATDATPAS